MHAIEQTYVSLLADVATKSGFSEIRGSYEGLQWCLQEAPKLEKLIVGSIESGVELDLSVFPSWLRRLAAGSLVDPVLLRLSRQLLLFSYKALVQHDNKTKEASFRSFISTNTEVGRFGNSLEGCSPYLLDLARKYVQSVLYAFQEKDLVPFHGPGASTTPKERWSAWYDAIEYVYPYSDWYSLAQCQDMLGQLDGCHSPDHIVAKLIAVPKDSRGPRLICVHPAEAIWLQQGLRVALERAIQSTRSSYGPWPKGRVRFDDQTANGSIALKSSLSRRYATLDMKEASDRVSDVLVQILFGRKYRYFGCCRAQKFVIEGFGSAESFDDNLHSYAPMGNATTFPVESLVFWAICCASLQRHGFHQPGAVFVFGDDILVPSSMAEVVTNDLESFGLVVNRTKSFWRGGFRESCGVDAFNGVNVTPVRWKSSLDAEHMSDLQSLSDIAMRLRIAGYEEAAITTYALLRARLSRYGHRLYCTNNRDHGGIAEFSSDANAWADSYWSKSLHWFHSPVVRVEPVFPKRKQDDWNHVLESVTSLARTGRSSIPDRTVSRRSRLIRGWTSIV